MSELHSKAHYRLYTSQYTNFKHFSVFSLVLCCLLAGLAIFSFWFDRYLARSLDTAEKLIQDLKIDEGLAVVTQVLHLDGRNQRAKTLFDQAYQSYELLGDKLVSSFRYQRGVSYYNRSLEIAYNYYIFDKREIAIEDSKTIKVIVENQPLNVEITKIKTGKKVLSLGPKVPYPDTTAPKTYDRGDALRLEILCPKFDEVSHISILLKNTDNMTVAQTKAFQYGENRDFHIYYALLGIPLYLKGGKYRLTGQAQDNTRNILEFSSTIEIYEKPFPEEVIPLNSGLTRLFVASNPRVEAEYQELNNILAVFDSQAVYHKGKTRYPLDVISITSFFGETRTYVYVNGNRNSSYHYGIDYSNPAGTTVMAIGDGKVVMAKPRIKTGNTVVIEHLPSVFSLYYHMSAINVKTDDLVTAGQKIGEVGSTGISTGAHLHLGLVVSGVYVDPELFLSESLLTLYAEDKD